MGRRIIRSLLPILTVAMAAAPGCVSLSRYHRDVDAAEMHGEAKAIIDCAVYVGTIRNKALILRLLDGNITHLQLRELNRELGIYEYHHDKPVRRFRNGGKDE